VADPNRTLFESVVHLLAPLLDELVFVGGCTTGLFITDPAAGGIRPTMDVDAIVDVNVAAYSQLDPWINAGWLFQFVRETSEAHRAEWARTFGRSLEAGSTEGSGAIWQRWLSSYWQARITGVPRPLADAEREAMVAWVCPLKGNLQDVIQLLASAPPDVLDHLTLYRLKQCGLAESHSAAIGRLLADLLPHVTEVRYDTGELFDLAAGALAGGADRANVQRIAAEMLRLGLMDGERLRRMTEAPDGA